ncbi:hypothetical protein G7075_13310 [Phycicoccus sp. HDW14]|uniref:D-alanyl-D-alanine carboxypeptidase family protein n=1 Tax=Phycicoccus sp. HDW14 TaxID=2714941 RepID=UPI001408B344|nr:D-alanyl-D-alanine carboxypeptidase family protein [Phycicoccus sp. HDW14]QIM21874.1 hypothetical protein G7075_13310 [Phycicoccus sp. HDW14]
MTAPAVGAGPSHPDLARVASPSVARMAGADRYATSVAASRAAFPSGSSPSVVYLVSGTSPWHSLSATPAAVHEGGGVLLTRADALPAVVSAELRRLRPGRVVLVGSTSVLSTAVARQAKSIVPEVTRVGGEGRYQTAQALVRHAFRTPVAHAWVATGRVWTDGVAAGSAAASAREPLLTVDGSATALPAAPLDLLADLGVTSVTLVGGTSAVSAGIERQLTGFLGAGQVTRATGGDRYAVARRVADLTHPNPAPGTSYVATGRDFVNALAGGFLAGRTKRPLYYTLPYCVPATVRVRLAGSATTRVTLLGGEGSVRSLVGTLETCRSITSPSSEWVLANKHNPLRPKSYVPAGLVAPDVSNPGGGRLRKPAAAALARMFSAARKDGAGRMQVASPYRSYSTQYSVYWNRVRTHGRAYADRWIARPGYSEHQTGLSLDIAPVGSSSCGAHNCIGGTPQGNWLKRNAWRYGFVLRYEPGYTSVTGYNSEPWHYRYVGTALAKAYHAGSWHSLEQFLGEPAAPTY